MDKVILVSSGYDFVCKECGYLNIGIKKPKGEKVMCDNCGEWFLVSKIVEAE